MKYAFLILAHTDPAQLRRLIHALDDKDLISSSMLISVAIFRNLLLISTI